MPRVLAASVFLLVGCAHADTPGKTLGIVGISTMTVGGSIATGCSAFDDEPCTDPSGGDPALGMPLVATGAGLLGLGVLLEATD
jgi:hypothetical protein